MAMIRAERNKLYKVIVEISNQLESTHSPVTELTETPTMAIHSMPYAIGLEFGVEVFNANIRHKPGI